MKGVSIILCFYNAEKKLSETIKYLMKLNIDGIEGIELIFVDNNSNMSMTELNINEYKTKMVMSKPLKNESIIDMQMT